MDRQRRNLLIWLLTTGVSVPLGWLVARPLSPPGSDLVWATLVFAPPWIALRLLVRGFHWNAFFFGFIPPVLAFEALEGMHVGLRQSALLVAVAPLVVYAILSISTVVMLSGRGAAWLAREDTDRSLDSNMLRRTLGARLRSGLANALLWYAIWLGCAVVGFGLALATDALARAGGIPAGAPALELSARVIVGLAGGGLAWALLSL